MGSQTLVVIGASGDLAGRLLFPALLSLEYRERLEDLKVIGYARQEWSTEEFHEHLRTAMEKHVDRRRGVHGTLHRPHRVPRRRHLHRVDAGVGQGDRRRRGVLPRAPARGVRRRRRDHRQGRARRRDERVPPAGDREAVRRRPRVRACAERTAAPVLARRPDLPHRPLPRQGDGPEHLGVPVREPVHRAGAASRARRRDPDHRRRRRSASKAGRGTTTASARCATWCRTTCCRC